MIKIEREGCLRIKIQLTDEFIEIPVVFPVKRFIEKLNRIATRETEREGEGVPVLVSAESHAYFHGFGIDAPYFSLEGDVIRARLMRNSAQAEFCFERGRKSAAVYIGSVRQKYATILEKTGRDTKEYILLGRKNVQRQLREWGVPSSLNIRGINWFYNFALK